MNSNRSIDVASQDTGRRLATRSPSLPIRAAIVGTGYIADFHARAIQQAEGVELICICDANLRSAEAFAARCGVTKVFDSLDKMLQAQRLDSVHILTPPDSHHSLARTALEAGSNVWIEKPMCVSADEANDLLELATRAGLRVGAGHNMLYASPYQRLREVLQSGILGPIVHLSIHHFVELKTIRFGPFDSWMLRAPGNVLLEIGPHLISAMIDLVGQPDNLRVIADRKADLPNGGHIYRRWRVLATVGSAAVDINIDLSPGFPHRTIRVHGLLGTAIVDFDNDTCTIDRRTPLSLDLDRYSRSRSLIRQIRSQARTSLSNYILSKAKLRARGNPYEITFLDSVAAFYAGLRENRPLDRRISGPTGRDVVEWCEKIICAASIEQTPAPQAGPRRAVGRKPSVLLIGATGFIGRALIRQLLKANYCVQVAVRGSAAALGEFSDDRLEIVRGNSAVASDLKSMMEGIEQVFYLAHTNFQTWDENLRRNVEPAVAVAESCLEHGVKRFVYTSTIDCYYAGAKAGTITERTPLDPNIRSRNYYARAKAEIEARLLELNRAKGLPVVIFRPGIVIGDGGNPFHFGIGMWASEGVCEVWGDGKSKLPFVLVSDVASAMVRGIQVDGIEGRSYNLVDAPLLTGRDYIAELQERTGMSADVRYTPIWKFYFADLFKWLVKVAVRHPDRTRIPSYRDWESRTQKAFFDCSATRTELAWRPASDRQRLIEDGIGGSLEQWTEACK